MGQELIESSTFVRPRNDEPGPATVASESGQDSASPSAAEDIAQRLVESGLGRITANIPRATYRVQFHPGFTFKDATAIVPYLSELGIGALYASPIFQARPGSTHGYDVIDYGSINAELGGEEDFAELTAALREHDMGLVLDFVPNHMGIGGESNHWWLDVVENGPWSPHAAAFDIDWEPIRSDLRNKILIPILGDHYGVVLEQGRLTLRFEASSGSFWLDYYDNPFPISPQTYPLILRRRLDDLIADYPADDPDVLELQSIIGSLERLPERSEDGTDPVAIRTGEQIVAKRRLADLVRRSEPVAAAVTRAVSDLNGTAGDPRSFDALDHLIERQAFRLAFWRVAAEEINYRRFFAINELAAIRQEEPEVFATTHELLLRLIGEGTATGVRIDHPDGLWDPAGYFADLQRAALLAGFQRQFDSEALHTVDGAPSPTWDEVREELQAHIEREPGPDAPLPVYLVIEKILEHGEELRADWPVHGTTGYEFANASTALFVDPTGRKAFDDLYASFIGEKVRFADMVYACKYLIMRVALASEVAVLATALDRITEHTRRSRDFTLNNLRDALREIIACFPVYRTYLSGCESGYSGVPVMAERDRRYVDQAIKEARKRTPALDPTVFEFIRAVILQEGMDDLTPTQREERCRFAMKFQQLTGPVMAKGLEDTAFYRYNRLTALNEVGGDPTQFGLAVAQFHRQNVERARRWPGTMLASSTHDTKRSEDVRARIAILSEIPGEWRKAINRWARLNRKHKTRVDGVPAPDRNDEYLFYQTLLGTWPFGAGRVPDGAFIERIEAYTLKALREGQVHTSWINPNDDYEAATSQFVRGALDGFAENPFLDDLAALQPRIAHCGAITSLAMLLLKLTSPGVPDLYQGTELWDLSLVDPDNRRPVDFGQRRQLLAELAAGAVSNDGIVTDILQDLTDGGAKLYVTSRALAFRAENPDLFHDGDYVALEASGSRRDHVVAFARQGGPGGRQMVTVVPRLVHSLLSGSVVMPLGDAIWGDTTLQIPNHATYRNLFDGSTIVTDESGAIAVADILRRFPVALLERIDSQPGEQAPG